MESMKHWPLIDHTAPESFGAGKSDRLILIVSGAVIVYLSPTPF